MNAYRLRHVQHIAVGTAAMLLAFSGSAFAQSPPLEEIVVTAQKVTQTIEEVPVAVSVLGESEIEASYSPNIESLQLLVPSLSFRKGTTTKNSALTLRGIGTISFAGGAEPSVATVVDGVVMARSGQAFSDLYDIERVEVLKGPQGTLFGKNASAGVVNIITKRPSDEFEGYVQTDFYEDDEYRVRARVSGELSDGARASITAFRSAFGGHITNVFNNRDVNGYEKWGLRAQFDLDISDSVTALFTFEHNESDDDCCADLEVLPSGRNPASAAAPNSNGIVNGNADLDLDQRLVDHDFETRMLDETDAVSAEFNWDLDSGHSVTSITGYREWTNTEYREGDFTSIGGKSTTPVFAVPFQLHDDGTIAWTQFSQEVRLASPQGDRLEYIAGVYFYESEQEADFTRNASCQNNGGQVADILAANRGLTCGANDIVSATGYRDVTFTNMAAFGQATYEVMPNLRLLFGARVSDDEIEFTHTRVNNDAYGRQGVGVRPRLPNGQFSEASGGYDNVFQNSSSNTNLSVKVGASYDLGDYGTAYVNYTQGYKGPGFNTFYNMGFKDALPIDEETSDAYEVGWKYVTANLLITAAAYSATIDGFQANNFDNSTGVTITRLTNAGSVQTQGLEFDFIWTPMENLNITGAFALNEAEIDEFKCPIDPTTGMPPANCSTRSGLDLLFSPDFNYTLGGDYTLSISQEMDFNVRLTWARVDDQNSLLPGNNGTFSPNSHLPGYDKLDMVLSLLPKDGRYSAALVMKNLLDESFVTTYSGDGFRYQIPRDAERVLGLSLKASF